MKNFIKFFKDCMLFQSDIILFKFIGVWEWAMVATFIYWCYYLINLI